MKKNILIAALFVSIGSAVYAEENDIKNTPTFKYLTLMREDAQSAIDLKNRFAGSPDLFCPAYKGKDEAGCMSQYIMNLKIKSSTQLVLLLPQVMHESALPKKERILRQLAAMENVILAFEKTDLSRFYLTEMNASTESEKTELSHLKADDEKEMTELTKKICTSVDKKLKEAEETLKFQKNPALAVRLQDLKQRLEKIKARSWKFS